MRVEVIVERGVYLEMTFNKLLRCTRTCVFLVLANAARAESVHVDFTPGFDFAGLKRYSWRIHPVFANKPELAEQYQAGIELVKNTVNQNLMSRGFQSTDQTPEFYVTFLLTGRAKRTLTSFISAARMVGEVGTAGETPITPPGRPQ